MASESSSPPNPADNKPQNPVAEAVESTNGTQQNVKASPPSVFVNSEPIREEQVQNAVKFLSHPRVRGSPVIYRRSFLEKKGLTKEEIDEAFQRVPDPSPSQQATNTDQAGQTKSTSYVQAPATTQPMHPVAAVAAPPGGVSSVGTLVKSRFHWYHAVFAVGILAVSGAGTAVIIKNAIVPRLKSWIRKVVAEEEDDTTTKTKTRPSLAEETAAAAKAAAAAAADVAKASQEILNSKNEDKSHLAELLKLLDSQVQEMKSMRTSINKLEGQTNNLVSASLIDRENHTVSVSNSKQTYANGKMELDSNLVRSAVPSSSAEPSAAPHPKSYMEIMEMVQRGERPPNVRDINDQPPNPNQQFSNPRLAPRTKPWEVSQDQNDYSQVFQSKESAEGSNYKLQDNGGTYQLGGESSAPWWQRTNTKITEIENTDDTGVGTYNKPVNERPVQPVNVRPVQPVNERPVQPVNERPVQRAWVPPQPPPVAMPEAAEAIRRPKPSVQKEQLADNDSVASPADATNELEKMTQASESGSSGVIKGTGSEINPSEILEEVEHIY